MKAEQFIMLLNFDRILSKHVLFLERFEKIVHWLSPCAHVNGLNRSSASMTSHPKKSENGGLYIVECTLRLFNLSIADAILI